MKNNTIKLTFITLILTSCQLQTKEQKVLSDEITELDQSIKEIEIEEIAVYERYSQKTDSIVEQISGFQKDISTFPELRKYTVLDDYIKIYGSDVIIDGTRSIIHLPILQWKEKERLYAFNLSKFAEFQFNQIISLERKSNLYLLIGNAKADGSCHQQIAYVVKIWKGEINVEYAAFDTRPFLNFCNGKFSYNKTKKSLTFKLDDESQLESLEEMFYQKDKYHSFAIDSSSAKKLYNHIGKSYVENRSFELQFNGEFFIIE